MLAECGILHKELGKPVGLNAWRCPADDIVCVKRKEREPVFIVLENKTHQNYIADQLATIILVRLRVLECN